MQQLSPKKYIETKVRSLPIYKCYVNKDWEAGKMADVFVLRKHVNGNVTAGVYLIDLLCLGVKDTLFMFNEPEQAVENRLGSDFHSVFKEIDYNLAHNIIYAGHDFAMEYDIHPHKDFATTRFILEEDSDNIPLIDVEVGAPDGKPHLMVGQNNQFPDALAKLKRNAGEGNYYYTIGGEFDEDDEYDGEDEWDEEENMIDLDTIPIGELTTINVQEVKTEDLMDEEEVEKRTLHEQIIINAEYVTRMLPDELTELQPEEDEEWDNIWMESRDRPEFPNGMSNEIMDEYLLAVKELTKDEPQLNDEEAEANNMITVLEAYSSNPMLVANIYETSTILHFDEVAAKAKVYVNQYQQQYPYLQIMLAFGALLNDTRDIRFTHIYDAKTIHEAFPELKQLHLFETISFWMIKMWQSLDEDNLKYAVHYYYMLASIPLKPLLFEKVLMKYALKLWNYIGNMSVKD